MDLTQVLFDTVKEYGASRATGKDMENVNVFRKKVEERITKDGNYTMLALRDAIYTVGDILYEDVTAETYKILIPLGNPNLKSALAVARIEDGNVHLCAYAKEGLINQHMARKAANKFMKALDT